MEIKRGIGDVVRGKRVKMGIGGVWGRKKGKK